MKILIVGAVGKQWMEFVGQIERLNHKVVPVTSFSQLIRTLTNDAEIDAVIVDTTASDKNAVNLLQRRSADRRLTNIPIIVAAEGFSAEQVSRYRGLEAFDLILLPVSEPTLEAKLLRALRGGKKTVLVVDDEPAIVDILSEHLEMERYRVLKALSAEAALEILRNETVHAVVTDIMMAGMSGLELMAEVKSHYSCIPVIIITGVAGKFTPADAIAAGADGYFAKPFKNLELAYTLSQVLTRFACCSHQPSRRGITVA